MGETNKVTVLLSKEDFLKGATTVTIKEDEVKEITAFSTVDKDALIEELADYAHKAWSGWMEYLFDKCKHELDEYPYGGAMWETGNVVIPKEFVDRWKRQSITDYKDLSEAEKESDRQEARKMLEIINKE